jgi:hypothetical protein
MSKIRFFSALFVILSVNLFGQDANDSKESPFSFGSDFVNRYIWRGVNLGDNTPSIQPNMSLNFGSEKHAFSLSTFGAYSMGGQHLQEGDLILSYTFNEILTLSVTDYFFPSDDILGSNRYFNYDKDKTGHVYEGLLSFNGTEKIPFSLMFAMNFYGADARKINTDGSDAGIFMSKYVEIGYTKEYKNLSMNLFIGGTIDDPDETKGEMGFYGNQSYGVINMGCKLTKEVKITENFSLPLQSQIIINPEQERIFLVFGFSL